MFRKTIAHVHTADLTFAPGHLTPVCYRSYGLTIILCLRRRVYTISQLEVSVRKKGSGHEYKFAPIHALSNFVKGLQRTSRSYLSNQRLGMPS